MSIELKILQIEFQLRKLILKWVNEELFEWMNICIMKSTKYILNVENPLVSCNKDCDSFHLLNCHYIDPDERFDFRRHTLFEETKDADIEWLSQVRVKRRKNHQNNIIIHTIIEILIDNVTVMSIADEKMCWENICDLARMYFWKFLCFHVYKNHQFSNQFDLFNISCYKTIFFRHFISCRKFKTACQSIYIMFIACSAFWIARESPMIMNIHWKILSFYNYKIFIF